MKQTGFLIILYFFSTAVPAQFMKATPPVAQKKEHWRTVQRDSVADNYYWMYDYFGKGPDSSAAVEYLKAENNYFDTVMSATKHLQQALYVEMKARIKEKDQTAPVFKNGYYYYTRTDEGEQYYKYCRKKGNLNAKEEILLDVDKLSKGYAYFDVKSPQVSEDNKTLMYAVDDVSRRQYKVLFKDLSTGRSLSDTIYNTEGNQCWANDNKTIFYISNNPVTLLMEKIVRHTIGANPKTDSVVYEEKDKSNFITVYKSKNAKHIIISSVSTTSSEIRMISAGKPYSAFRIFQPRMKNVLYQIFPLNNKFLILTNKDSALNYRLMECPLNETGVAGWKTVVAHRDSVLIQDVEEFGKFFVLLERRNGLVNIRVRTIKTNRDHYLHFDDPAYSVEFNPSPDFKGTVLNYKYSSLVTPTSDFAFNMQDQVQTLLKKQVLPDGYNSKNYVSERFYVTSADGTKIPVSLVYKKGIKKDGHAPLLLYGYGSYGISTETVFSRYRLSLINRGFICAFAHVRGGQELGRSWYENGKMMHKKNTFLDFISCGEYLVKEKYTGKDHLYAYGGSAGGLLMGAVVNMSPDLWNGIIAEVPFVDVVNTMLDKNIPLTTNEYEEWGNPASREAYFYMKSYSPYENVERKGYPNMLVMTGLYDSQVQYFEPSKWVAKLRAKKTDDTILLLKTNMDYGHGGASGRFDFIKEFALQYTFLLTLEGMNK